MSKSNTDQYICTNCNFITTKWLGQCKECNEWNTFVEYTDVSVDSNSTLQNRKNYKEGSAFTIDSLDSILNENKLNVVSDYRFITNNVEIDRVFGGGIVRGSMTLLAGEPGIGKSTLTLDICKLIATNNKVLYVSGEESISQIADRAKRMGIKKDSLYLANINSVEDILATAYVEKPDFLVVDSVQVIYAQTISGASGSISQIRFVTELLLEFAKKQNITVLLIGHVTKDGNLAGPKSLEHLVDTVLLLEGERSHSYRILRSVKNRFGPTDEVGVFSMSENGLNAVENPSLKFLEGRLEGSSGSVITATVEGTRSFLLEVQALTTYTKFGYPKRASVGFDINRLQLLLAVISKYTKTNLDSYDVYINVVGGLKIRESGLDLAIALSILSSKLQKAVSNNLVAFGEIGLTGEIRSLSFLKKRILESKKMGITKIIIPYFLKDDEELSKISDVEFVYIKHISELLKVFEN